MSQIVIHGGKPLYGEIAIDGMKNAALPIIFATLLCHEPVTLHGVPNVSDTADALQILYAMRANVTNVNVNTVVVDTANLVPRSSPFALVSRIRASSYLLGAELGRFGITKVAMPGGCNFGKRPLDIHLDGFHALGATMEYAGNNITGEAIGGLHGTGITLRFPSVGATANILLACVTAEGTTVISGAKQSVGSDLVFPDKLSNGEDGAAVVEIGEAAFTPSVYTESKIATVTTPLYLTKISDGAFYQVKTLKTLTITPSRDYRNPTKRAGLIIGDSAFASTALESVLIPETVTNIADYAFINCAKLKTIVFAGNEKIACSGAAFERCGYETEGGIRIYMSDDFKRENDGLVDDIIAHNPSVKVTPMVGYSPAVGTRIAALTPDDNDKVSILVDVKTLVNGTLPDPSTVRLRYAPTVEGLSGDGVALEGLTKQVFDDGMLLFEFVKPNSEQAFFTVVIE